MQKIAIMNDCDCLDIRDFDSIRQPWEEVGISIDWSFYISGEEYWKRWFENTGSLRGISYEDFHPFDLIHPVVEQHVNQGFLRTIHCPLRQFLYTPTKFLQALLNKIQEPILSAHGYPHRNTMDILDRVLKLPISSRFLVIFRGNVKELNKKTEINFGKFFKRVTVPTSDFYTLKKQIELTNGYDAILSTHLAHGYKKDEHLIYLKQVDETIKAIEQSVIKVVEVRQLVKMLRLG